MLPPLSLNVDTDSAIGTTRGESARYTCTSPDDGWQKAIQIPVESQGARPLRYPIKMM